MVSHVVADVLKIPEQQVPSGGSALTGIPAINQSPNLLMVNEFISIGCREAYLNLLNKPFFMPQ